MLSLTPPYLTSGDLVLFRDDKIADCFYYVNQVPHISRDKKGRPVLSIYTIVPESSEEMNRDDFLESGMTLDVDLGVSDEELEEARKAIKKHYGTTARVLVPAPLHSGSVHFAMAQAGDEPDPSQWFVTSDVTPTLVGENRVSLTVRAKGREAKLMIAAANQEAIPACFYYDLKVLGITPVFHARMVAHMETIFHRLKERDNFNLIFYSHEIEKELDDLRTTKALEFFIEETDPDIHSQAMSSLMNDLKTQVVERFFEPVTLLSMQGRNNDLHSSNLISSFIGCQTLKQTIDESQISDLTIDLRQSNAKTVPMCPTASLNSMILRAGIDLSELIQWIRLDDLPMFKQTVGIRLSPETFDGGNIKEMLVTCQVVDVESGEIVMDPDSHSFSPGGEFSWDRMFDRRRDREYGYEYKVDIRMAGGSGRLPEIIHTDWKRVDCPFIYLHPSDFYRTFNLSLMLSDRTLFDQALMVQADVTVVNAKDGSPVMEKQLLIMPDDYANKQVSFVTDKELKLEYIIRLTYFLPGEKNQKAEFRGAEESVFFIPNPFENRWSVDLICKADWDSVLRVYLDTKIFDAERDLPIEQHIVFTSEKEEDRLTAAVSLDTPDREFDYLVTRLDMDGKMTKSGWHQHKESPILVVNAPNIKSERVYRFRLKVPEEMKREGVALLNLTFDTDPAGNPAEIVKPFTTPDDVLVFSCPWESAPSYKVLMKDEDNAIVCRTNWTSVPGDNIEIAVSQLISQNND